MSSQRSGILELAILGILHETPMHGYELRKRLSSLLGAFRAFGYGSLYPALKDLLGKGLIAEDSSTDPGRPLDRPRLDRQRLDRPRRSKIVYRLTAEGKERLSDLLGESGPSTWEDDGFGVHFAFFGLTQAEVRMRILEGRRSRLEERLEAFRAAVTRTRERVDSYTLELQRHGLESVERDVRWLNELIASERQGGGQSAPGRPPTQTRQSTPGGGASAVS
ncbi:MAG: PadR family transcriptional regulator [Actinobacteria bacterium]|nr:PadR family transcriptional regulator [Actinomycetota bacterium]